MDISGARAMLRTRIQDASRLGLTKFEFDYSGTCQNVRHREYNLQNFRDAFPGRPGLTLVLHVRCRKCEDCRARRRALWYARAQMESAMSQRNWFVTLTLRPEVHVQCSVRAEQRCRRRAVAWRTLNEVEQFREVHAEISKEITRWIKRVRKNSGAILRLLCVTEAHKSGLPHYHVLVHELAGTCSYRDICEAWTYGFSTAKLVEFGDYGAVGYVTKYIAKSALTRVRASVRYGQGHVGLGRVPIPEGMGKPPRAQRVVAPNVGTGAWLMTSGDNVAGTELYGQPQP